MGIPVRLAEPENLVGMVDKLIGPAFSTGVGLLRWALLMSEIVPQARSRRTATASYTNQPEAYTNWDRIKNFLRRLLP
jgi:cell division protein FtsA